MAITTVGSFTNSGSPLSGWTGTLAVTATNLGDIFVVASYVTSTTNHYTSLSGGGVTTWQHLLGTFVGTSGTVSMDIWMGVITSTGSVTITGTGSASLSGVNNGMACQEFTVGSSAAIWSVDGSGGTQSNASSTSMAYPTLTPAVTGELYFGVGSGGNPTGTVSSGYTSTAATWDFGTVDALFNPALGTGAQTPTATVSPAAASRTMGILIKGVVPSGSPRIMNINQAVKRASFY